MFRADRRGAIAPCRWFLLKQFGTWHRAFADPEEKSSQVSPEVRPLPKAPRSGRWDLCHAMWFTEVPGCGRTMLLSLPIFLSLLPVSSSSLDLLAAHVEAVKIAPVQVCMQQGFQMCAQWVSCKKDPQRNQGFLSFSSEPCEKLSQNGLAVLHIPWESGICRQHENLESLLCEEVWQVWFGMMKDASSINNWWLWAPGTCTRGVFSVFRWDFYRSSVHNVWVLAKGGWTMGPWWRNINLTFFLPCSAWTPALQHFNMYGLHGALQVPCNGRAQLQHVKFLLRDALLEILVLL